MSDRANRPDETIAAISTPPGKGGVALIRISGPQANAIADRVLQTRKNALFSDTPPRVQVRVDVVSDGERIDDGMAVRFPAPHSYTGEDVVEICCHGGVLVTRSVLEAVLSAGAVAAAPGEFTRRGFVNGKISLTEAEGIGDLLDAQSTAELRLSAVQSRERLAAEIEAIREGLLGIMSSIYARIDYPDEDLGEFTDEQTAQAIREQLSRVETLIRSYRTGRVIREGIRTVICGKPNVGKSSLYNLLVGEDVAIVTDIEGTTRDLLERPVALGEVKLLLTDTAGVRSTQDPIERIGVERSRERIRTAELVLAMFDGSRPISDEDHELIDLLKTLTCPVIVLVNKDDLQTILDKNEIISQFLSVISFSTARGDVDALSAMIRKMYTDEGLTPGQDAIVSSARQYAKLCQTRDRLAASLEAYTQGVMADAASSDLELALAAIGELDGKSVSDAIVADIFSKFCVGK